MLAVFTETALRIYRTSFHFSSLVYFARYQDLLEKVSGDYHVLGEIHLLNSTSLGGLYCRPEAKAYRKSTIVPVADSKF